MKSRIIILKINPVTRRTVFTVCLEILCPQSKCLCVLLGGTAEWISPARVVSAVFASMLSVVERL